MSVQFKKRSRTNKSTRVVKDDNEDEKEEERITELPQLPKVGKGGITSSKNEENNTKSNVTTIYESTREVVPQSYAGGAFAENEIDTSKDRDARAILEKKNETYKVSNNKLTGAFGPMRAPSFLRSTSRFDYQPDICKDYKETGFCGYGDNCKFLHDRGDYKAGWQLEKEWDEEQAAKKRKLKSAVDSMISGDNEENEVEEEEENYEILEEEFPFACFICREGFTNPVVTLCEHYFCQDCAISHSKKEGHQRCAACNKQTFGVFNKARKLIRHMEKINKIKNSGKESQVISDDKNMNSEIAENKKIRIKKGSWEEVEE